MAAFPLGVALAAVGMRLPALARAVPIAVGIVVVIAGALQFTAWKAYHLARYREAPRRGRPLPAHAATAWRLGVRLGLHCGKGSAGLTVILCVWDSWTCARWLSWGGHHRRTSRAGR
jgi:predicted metal-binding membrane protein